MNETQRRLAVERIAAAFDVPVRLIDGRPAWWRRARAALGAPRRRALGLRWQFRELLRDARREWSAIVAVLVDDDLRVDWHRFGCTKGSFGGTWYGLHLLTPDEFVTSSDAVLSAGGLSAPWQTAWVPFGDWWPPAPRFEFPTVRVQRGAITFPGLPAGDRRHPRQ